MNLQLSATVRAEVGKKVAAIRANGLVPAVLYGHGVTNQNLAVPYGLLDKLYQAAGESTIIDLAIEGQPSSVKVLIADVQYEPVKNRISHVDLQQINMSEKITVSVPIHVIGESPVIKADGGSLVNPISEVEIEALPSDLIHGIEIDASILATYDDAIHIKDLKVPATVTIVGHEPEDVVLFAAPAHIEKEPEVVIAPTEAAPVAATPVAEEAK